MTTEEMIEQREQQAQCRHYWLEAMRSGEYAQCTNSYRKKFRQGNVEWEEFDPVGVARVIFENCYSEENVSKITGVRLQVIKEAVELNDSGYSWDEIADFIEENFEEDVTI